ncbi:GGDEF domain-containing protein, partial [Pseudomonas gingeri]|uniref:GGDEF domain-containing protein n=1 Tax=Pseudomonas gingeri TaxID=117681 RepID=UPI0015A45B7D
TGLPNRELFKEHLQQASLQAKHSGHQVAVAILDLDNFKVINNTLGQESGDELLREAAARLQSFEHGDNTVARLGGAEFALIFTGVSTTIDLDNLGRKILHSITGIYGLQDQEVFVSGSLGIASSPTDADSASNLLQHAHSAMSYAKLHGRNNVQRYSPRLTQQTAERLALAASLRHAQHNGE